MGSHWGSIHFRTEDRGRVLAALEPLAAQGMRFLVGPPLGGWVGVYPSIEGRTGDETVTLGTALGVDAVELILHDDDVFAYNFVRGGKLVDEYVNKPGYFTDADRAKEEPLIGNVNVYADLLRKPAAAVQKILQRGDQGAFEPAVRLAKFAKALGITNAETSYEYLQEGEPSGVKGRRQFVNVPPEASMKAAKQAKADALQRQIDDLKAAGKLVAVYAGAKRQHFTLCPGIEPGGFTLARAVIPLTEPLVLQRLAPPWPKKPVPLRGESIPGNATIAVSPSGRWLAIGGQPVRLVDLRNSRVTEYPSGYLPWFSHDDRCLVIRTQDGLQLIWLEGGPTVHLASGDAHDRVLALHPDGSVLLIATQFHISVIPTAGGEPRRIYPGGRSAALGVIGPAVAQQMRNIDLVEYERDARIAVEKQLSTYYSATDVESMRATIDQQIATLVANMVKLQRGQLQGDERANEQPVTAAFSTNGKRLCVGTNVGLRVYDWADIADGDDDPKPLFSVEDAYASQFGNYIYAVLPDEPRDRLLFGGIGGTLYAMDLTDGHVRICYSMPDRGSIVTMHPSRDGSLLAVRCQQSFADVENLNDNRQSVYVFRTPD